MLITKCVNMDNFIFTTCDAVGTIPPKTHLLTLIRVAIYSVPHSYSNHNTD